MLTINTKCLRGGVQNGKKRALWKPKHLVKAEDSTRINAENIQQEITFISKNTKPNRKLIPLSASHNSR